MPSVSQSQRQPRARSRAKPATAGATVAVVGGGIAGLTAALRLSEAGFAVTIYEARDRLGGNLASEEVNGVTHDVYPHMFCDWYRNFWSLFENDLGLRREDYFAPRDGARFRKADWEEYRGLTNGSTPSLAAANLTSGVLSPAEMFLAGFSMLDLASHAFDRETEDQLGQLSVNGFIYSRGYATENVAKLQDYLLTVIWSIRSNVTSAVSYQDFLKSMATFPRETPFAWLLKTNFHEGVIRPMQTKLGCKVRCDAKVRRVEIVDGKPHLAVETATDGERTETPDYVVLAVPAETLADLVMTGTGGQRIVDYVPQLAQLEHARSVAIPVVDLYLDVVLPDLPAEQVGFMDSPYELTMLDLSQLWTNDRHTEGRTALAIAASHGAAIPSRIGEERGHLMIKELHRYLKGFRPGDYWGDPNSDVCWEKTHYRSNDDSKLFLNDVGSTWRPQTSYGELPRVTFAGDFCRTDIDMATVETAVKTGLQAAEAIRSGGARAGLSVAQAPFQILAHEPGQPGVAFLAAKLAAMPLAYACAAWSMALTAAKTKHAIDLPGNAYSTFSGGALVLPWAYVQDWCETAFWLARTLAERKADDQPAPAEKADTRTDADPMCPPRLTAAFREFVVQAARTVEVICAKRGSSAAG